MREPIDSRVETTHAVTQTFRQHRDNAVRQIDAVSAAARFEVERAIGLYVSGNIGNMNAETPTAALDLFDINRVIEVPRVIRINGDNKFLAQIFTPVELSRVDLFRNPIRLIHNVIRKLSRQMIFANDR